MTIKGRAGEQLPMFMSVDELKNLRPNDFVTQKVYQGSIGDPSRFIQKGWEMKLQEAQMRSGRPQSMVDRVRDHGVELPVTVGHYNDPELGRDDFLKDGHHRVAAAAATKPRDYLVPVYHVGENQYQLPEHHVENLMRKP